MMSVINYMLQLFVGDYRRPIQAQQELLRSNPLICQTKVSNKETRLGKRRLEKRDVSRIEDTDRNKDTSQEDARIFLQISAVY